MADFDPRRRIIQTARLNEPPQINMSRIEIGGAGGLGMLAVAAWLAFALPEVRLFVLLSLACGILLGLARIRYRDAHGPWDSDNSDHPLLDLSHADATPRSPLAETRPHRRRRIFCVPSTLSGLCPETLWLSWRRPPRGPVSCIS